MIVEDDFYTQHSELISNLQLQVDAAPVDKA